MLHFRVTQCRLFRVGSVVTSGAGYVCVPTVLGAGRRLCSMLYCRMTQCGHLIIHIAILADTAGIGGVTLFSACGCGNHSFIVMLSVENVNLIIITAIPQRDVHSQHPFGSNQIPTVGAEFRIGSCRIGGLQYAVDIKPGDTNTIGRAMTVDVCSSEGGCKDLVARIHGDSHRGHIPGGMIAPAAAAIDIVCGVMLQNRPQVQVGANIVRQIAPVLCNLGCLPNTVDNSGFRFTAGAGALVLTGSLAAGYRDSFPIREVVNVVILTANGTNIPIHVMR